MTSVEDTSHVSVLAFALLAVLTPGIDKARQESQQGQADADPKLDPAPYFDERADWGQETTDDVEEKISTGRHWC
jgi:hypothetical protein